MPGLDRKPRVVILNDTSWHNHHGCRRVMATIRHCLAQRGLEIVGTALAGAPWTSDRDFLGRLATADLILINGEGTLHHGAELGARLLAVTQHPARGSKPVALINTVFQDNPPAWVDRLGEMRLVATRDRVSQAELQALGIAAACTPDLSLYMTARCDFAARDGLRVAYGDSVFPKVKRALRKAYLNDARPRLYLPIHTSRRYPAPWPELPLRRRIHAARFKIRAGIRHLGDRGHRLSSDDEGFLRNLGQASIYLTGRYHGVCLAIAGGTPFRAIASNSRKIEALLEEAGLEPGRLAPSVDEIAESSAERWQFSAREVDRLGAFLAEGRRRTDALFDRIAELARPLS